MRRGDNCRFLATQEGIACLLFAEQQRDRRLSSFPLRRNGLDPFLDDSICRLDCQGKRQIHRRIFMRAVNQRGIRQRGNARQGIGHLSRRTFEQTSATGPEQRIATEQHARSPIGQMAPCVPGDRPNLEPLTEHLDHLTARQGVGAACDRLFGRSIDDSRRPAFKQGRDTALMVGMMMSDQNTVQLQSFGLESGDDRYSIAGIDDRGMSAES